MTLQEFYTRIGGNYDDTLRRIPSEALVRKFVLKYPNDPSFGQLKDALAAQDWETAFRASHTLKGVAQNLGMEHLYQVSSALCEAVRGSKPPDRPCPVASRRGGPCPGVGSDPGTVSTYKAPSARVTPHSAGRCREATEGPLAKRLLSTSKHGIRFHIFIPHL